MADDALTSQDSWLWKVLATAAAFVAAFIVQKIVSAAWKGVVGHEPPDAEDTDNDAPLMELAVSAAITGAAAAVARNYAVRGTKKVAARAAVAARKG